MPAEAEWSYSDDAPQLAEWFDTGRLVLMVAIFSEYLRKTPDWDALIEHVDKDLENLSVPPSVLSKVRNLIRQSGERPLEVRFVGFKTLMNLLYEYCRHASQFESDGRVHELWDCDALIDRELADLKEFYQARITQSDSDRGTTDPSC